MGYNFKKGIFIIKNKLKNNNVIRKKYKKIVLPLLIKCSPVFATKVLYWTATSKKLNLKDPKDYNEKLQWLKLYWQHPLVSRCADKYEVRNYVKECGCEELLNELYGVYENIEGIEWNNLPQKFVLKTTNGCCTNIICNDKNKINKSETLSKLDEWLKVDYGFHAAEIHYSKIKPRIICEKYIETKEGLLPNDYKIFCFNGTPKFVFVGLDREIKYKKVFLDLNWNNIDIIKEEELKKNDIKKPQCFEKMIYYAARLSKPFPFVRIDFYDCNNKPILGEMTFTPKGCIANDYKEDALKMLGDWIVLPEKYTY